MDSNNHMPRRINRNTKMSGVQDRYLTEIYFFLLLKSGQPEECLKKGRTHTQKKGVQKGRRKDFTPTGYGSPCLW